MITSHNKYFSATVLNGWDLHGSSLHSHLERARALRLFSTNMSEGSVASEIFNDQFTTNLLPSLPMTEFWKSISIFELVITQNTANRKSTRPYILSCRVGHCLRHFAYQKWDIWITVTQKWESVPSGCTVFFLSYDRWCLSRLGIVVLSLV